MRVLHWFPNYFHGGGVANAVTGLAHAQADRGTEVAIAGLLHQTPPIYGEQPDHPEVELLRWHPITTLRVSGLRIRPPSAMARATLRAWKPDVVHIHAEFAPDNLWVLRLFDCPIVLSFHGAVHPEVFRKGKTVPKQLYLEIARRTLYRRVERFIALCPAEAAHIDRVLHGRAIDTIPLGPGRFVVPTPDDDCSHRDRLRGGRGLRVVYVGRLDVYTKGLDVLVAAFAGAKERVGGRLESLTLVGPDTRGGRRLLEEQVRTLGLQGSVKLVGGVPAAEVQRFLSAADVYAQLSRHDAFPLSVVDALVTGMAALLSSSIGSTSFSEVACLPHVRITEPQIDSATSALAALVAGYSEFAPDIQRATTAVRELFSWDRIAEAHLESYRAAQG